MSHRNIIALGVCACALSMAALVGCSSSATINGLPANHFTDSTGTTIEPNHSRCGACHEGANRGNLSFEYTSQLEIIQDFNNDAPERTPDVGSSIEIIQSFNLDYMDMAQPVPEQ